MKRFLTVAILAVALSTLVTGTALASNVEQDGTNGGDIAVALAPLAAAALAIERLLEMVFARVESLILDVAKAADFGGDYVK
jgi:hypothetical protein